MVSCRDCRWTMDTAMLHTSGLDSCMQQQRPLDRVYIRRQELVVLSTKQWHFEISAAFGTHNAVKTYLAHAGIRLMLLLLRLL